MQQFYGGMTVLVAVSVGVAVGVGGISVFVGGSGVNVNVGVIGVSVGIGIVVFVSVGMIGVELGVIGVSVGKFVSVGAVVSVGKNGGDVSVGRMINVGKILVGNDPVGNPCVGVAGKPCVAVRIGVSEATSSVVAPGAVVVTVGVGRFACGDVPHNKKPKQYNGSVPRIIENKAIRKVRRRRSIAFNESMSASR